ncbi:MAG: glycosyltransferase family 2 protein [Candidatus Thermoplasmatota archaeon]|nr:glycosyltransferase family 2 protein [Candidatus Thermoplasmatota archaeon]
MQDKPRILAAIPCYNEESTVGSVVVKARQHVDQVLIIDDGSTDGTARVAKAAGATVVRHDYNRGKAAGIKEAFRYALDNDFDIVVTVDGDGQHDADEIPQIVAPLLSDQADLAIGFRHGQRTEMPFWRKMGKRTLDYVTSIGAKKVTDSQCGFRAFNQKAFSIFARRLIGDGFSLETEELILAKEEDLRVHEIKISCRYKNLNSSKKNPIALGSSIMSYAIWLIAEKRPLLFIGVPGLVMILAGFYFGIKTLDYYNRGIAYLSGALIATTFIIIGSLAILMSILLNILPHVIKRAREKE